MSRFVGEGPHIEVIRGHDLRVCCVCVLYTGDIELQCCDLGMLTLFELEGYGEVLPVRSGFGQGFSAGFIVFVAGGFTKAFMLIHADIVVQNKAGILREGEVFQLYTDLYIKLLFGELKKETVG